MQKQTSDTAVTLVAIEPLLSVVSAPTSVDALAAASVGAPQARRRGARVHSDRTPVRTRAVRLRPSGLPPPAARRR